MKVQGMKNLVSLSAAILLLVVGVISAGGLLSEADWRLAWYSNPRPHLLFAACVAFVWFLSQQNRTLMLASAGVALVNLVVLVPFLLPIFDQPTSVHSFSLLHLNTNKGAAHLDGLTNGDVDILFLQEVTPALDQAFGELFPSYHGH